ncbi:glycosyltransferase family 1 protein [Bifidobacterium leontopitheci]|uniref:Glycosyl transferase family 1 n=1 Tax=Bifidobacterium leontopitheci TaxID=2650774 RepID=A0A6I1GDE9_9BIFI|nr:glycosyltransferase family 1 protein [Bifidobacterium leontopitheci]KAB7789545.1 glycosyl transferase family 1 [Bifidobacterium leontopitheci]
MSEPIRILQWGMLGGRGGIEIMIMNLYRHMDRSKVQFDFLCDYNAGKLAFEDEIIEMGGRIYRVMVPQRESMIKSRTAMMQFFREHPEIQGVHVNANFPYALPLKYAKKSGMALRILHSHNSGSGASHEHNDVIHNTKQYIRHCHSAWQINRYPNAYFACSKAAADYMFPGKPYTWIRNGIDTQHFAYDPTVRDSMRKKLGIKPSTSVIGFCGRFREQKNPLFLIDVFAEYHKMVPDSLLLLIGIGEMRDQMDERIENLGIADSVRFMGAQAGVSPYYQAMDALLLPSLFEGLPVVVVEAQCAGLPCIVAEEAVSSEACLTDHIRFVSLQNTAASWAAEMNKTISQFGIRHDSSKEVRASGFDIRDVAADLQNLYLNVMGV